ncbi:MAG: efflux RND transporter permease subunit [Gammaproteobacteria bacterium]|nr:efflux RND transporter permease subunit [Gammaproteobacteria bacterium]
MKLVDISTRRPVTVMMFTTALLIFGMVSLSRLGMNLLPDLSYPSLTIRTDYSGAAPAEVENLITKPVEETLGIIKNIREVRSISRAGQSDVVLEFNWGTDMDIAGLDVREKLDVLQLPLDVKRPSLLRFNPENDPVMRLSLAFKSSPKDISQEDQLKSLRRLADEQIKKQLEATEGVAAVKISGGLEDEIQVQLDPRKLGQLGLSIEQVAQKLKAENVNLSGGRLEEGQQQFLVRTINQYRSVEEIAGAIVAEVGGKPIYLRDIATVEQGFKERTAITRINGQEAVEIALYKEGDANTVRVAEAIAKRLEDTRKALPEALSLDVLYDQSTFIGNAIDDVVQNGLVGGVLAVLVLYLFLRNFWVTVIIACTIPLSVVITFNLMYANNVGLNIMSLGGIALSIGMLLDNAIVVLENIASKRERGADLLTAARDGTSEVAGALLASTLTSVAVFFPLVFVEGIAGQLFRDQALTVTYGQFISLGIGLTLVPMLAALGARAKPSGQGVHAPDSQGVKGKLSLAGWGIFTGLPLVLTTGVLIVSRAVARLGHLLFAPAVLVFNKAYAALAIVYRRLLTWSLGHRFAVLAIALGIFGASLTLVPGLGVDLIPQMSQGEFNIAMRLPPGTPLASTDASLLKAQGFTATLPAIERSYSVSGTGNRLDASPDKGGENWGELNVVMKKPVTLDSERELMNRLRGELDKQAGLEYKIERPTLFSFKTPLEIEIVGYDLDKLAAVSQQIVAKMGQSDRYSDIKSTTEGGHPEVQIRFDHERIARLGLTVPDIADRVVKQVRGEVATRYSFRDRKIDVLVRAQESERNSVRKIGELVVATRETKPITLAAVADIGIATGPSEIHRVAQERVALISANLRYGDLGQAAQELEAILATVPMPTNVTSRVAGQNEEMKRSFNSLYMALGLAVFLVYLVMASQFESLKQPLIILFSIPLGLVGAILALKATGSSISVIVFIGLILLAGVVTNNAIVLLDRVNQLRAEGMKIVEALKEAGESRLRPIMMTMFTSVLGMLPLALGVGEGAELRQPMAITVIGGLFVATLLTLVVIPVIYSLVERDA